MFEQIENIDQNLFLFLNGLHADWLDPVMWYISEKWLWFPLYLFFLIYIFIKKDWKAMLFVLIGTGICVGLSDLISVHLFKETFQRYRPTHNLKIGHLVHTVVNPSGDEYRGGLYGFVSSHASNHMAIATFIYLQFRSYSKWWGLLFLWAILISYSRIYLGVHYPSDILVGMLIGFGIALTLNFSLKQIRTKLLSS